MNSAANKNEFPGPNAHEVPPNTLCRVPAPAKIATRLEISWDVSFAQTVAIVDPAGSAFSPDLPPPSVNALAAPVRARAA